MINVQIRKSILTAMSLLHHSSEMAIAMVVTTIQQRVASMEVIALVARPPRTFFLCGRLLEV